MRKWSPVFGSIYVVSAKLAGFCPGSDCRAAVLHRSGRGGHAMVAEAYRAASVRSRRTAATAATTAAPTAIKVTCQPAMPSASDYAQRGGRCGARRAVPRPRQVRDQGGGRGGRNRSRRGTQDADNRGHGRGEPTTQRRWPSRLMSAENSPTAVSAQGSCDDTLGERACSRYATPITVPPRYRLELSSPSGSRAGGTVNLGGPRRSLSGAGRGTQRRVDAAGTLLARRGRRRRAVAGRSGPPRPGARARG